MKNAFYELQQKNAKKCHDPKYCHFNVCLLDWKQLCSTKYKLQQILQNFKLLVVRFYFALAKLFFENKQNIQLKLSIWIRNFRVDFTSLTRLLFIWIR